MKKSQWKIRAAIKAIVEEEAKELLSVYKISIVIPLKTHYDFGNKVLDIGSCRMNLNYSELKRLCHSQQ